MARYLRVSDETIKNCTDAKKNPKQTLENYSKIFMQGLVVALFVAYLVIEQKSYQENVSPSGDVIFTVDPEEEPPIVKVKEPEIPPRNP